jgi:hypothetical protein
VIPAGGDIAAGTMIVSVLNRTHGALKDEELQRAIRAVNHQISADFAAYWQRRCELRLEGCIRCDVEEPHACDRRGDAVLYFSTALGSPFGCVFPALSRRLGESWTVALSHAALEMLVDPDVNQFVLGPHPTASNEAVFHWQEVCDAVQAEHYEIDGVAVSNFVLPSYFTAGEDLERRNDFLARTHNGRSLRSFGVNPGGSVGYFDPATGRHELFRMFGDTQASDRERHRTPISVVRRAARHRVMLTGRRAQSLLTSLAVSSQKRAARAGKR